MYVDESGDPGNNVAQSEFFCLTGLVVHESEWRNFIGALENFRRTAKQVYGLPVRSEVHAVKFLRHSEFGIEKYKRLALLRNFIDEISKLTYISITNVVVRKRNKPTDFDIFSAAWRTLFQRFENTLVHGNFPGSYSRSFGTVFTDATNGEKLLRITRRMSVYNPIPSVFGGYRNLPILRIIEDPSHRDSRHSLPIQACDTVAYFLHQSLKPNAYVRKSGAVNYFNRLEQVLNKNASKSDAMGIVYI